MNCSVFIFSIIFISKKNLNEGFVLMPACIDRNGLNSNQK